MKIEELYQHWEKDSQIDHTELGSESLKIPQLHSKYFKFFTVERITLKNLQRDYKKLYKVKHEYYTGNLSEEELKANSWDPQPLRILKNELGYYLDADQDLQQIQMKIDLQQEKVDFLESIIKSLTNRGFQIKAAIDWIKFTNGIS